ncbi:MAG: hypothetical protein COA78_27395 [Blastopirellula sp.]|nr:MAG: hypothetical protein COA78_27395 [Blastopirellula sp.]
MKSNPFLLAGSIGLMLSTDKRKKKTQFEAASERFFSEHWDWDEPLEKEPEIDLDLSEDDWNNQTIDQTWATEKDWGLKHFADHNEPAPGNTATLPAPQVRKNTKPIAYQPKPKNVLTEFPSAKEESTPTKNKSIFWASIALILLGPILLLAGLFGSSPPPLEPPLLPELGDSGMA